MGNPLVMGGGGGDGDGGGRLGLGMGQMGQMGMGMGNLNGMGMGLGHSGLSLSAQSQPRSQSLSQSLSGLMGMGGEAAGAHSLNAASPAGPGTSLMTGASQHQQQQQQQHQYQQRQQQYRGQQQQQQQRQSAPTAAAAAAAAVGPLATTPTAATAPVVGPGPGAGRAPVGASTTPVSRAVQVQSQVAALAHHHQQQQQQQQQPQQSQSPSSASPPPPSLAPTTTTTNANVVSGVSAVVSAATSAAHLHLNHHNSPGAASASSSSASSSSSSSSSRSLSRSSHPHSHSHSQSHSYSHSSYGYSHANLYSNHNHLHGHVQQQHPPPPHPHPGASSSTTSSSAFYTTNSNANPGFTNTAAAAAPDHAHAPAHAVSTRRPSAMEPGDPSDVAAQEAAARDYQPQLEGLLVGDKITSDAITDEYAKADEIYIAKTICFWSFLHSRTFLRHILTIALFKATEIAVGEYAFLAIGFSYFEHLINNGDQHQILGEAARITSLNQYLLNVGGYDRMLFEDMVEETIGLLKDVAQNIANPQLAMDIMVQRFNDQGSSNAIIYHLRLLALSWLKGNVELYEPFIPAETGIIGYCAEIERPNREIDHLGIILLVQVLLKPINFVLEIAYLDRSPGNQVNIYRFPDEANGQDPATLGPIIYLLYRPDHYDILYKSPPNPAPLNLQVHRVGSFSHSQEIASVGPPLHSYSLDYGPLAMLPGFGGPPSGLSSALSSLGSPTSTSPLPDAYDPSPQSPWLATPFSDHIQQQQQQQQQQHTAPAPRPQSQTPARPQQSTPAPAKPSQPVDYQLRFSHQCWHLNNTSSAQPSVIPGQAGFQEPSFTTAMFKNSHFNKAHYNNPHFHPEEWTPDDDGHHERLPAPKKKGRVRPDH
ncbi:hypothetical protein COL516b_005149 [Colletotrichum fioriniae]|nr:uncharacterized protein COL516b_005149 [Colletotrichum fioriniae]KAJ0305455.1 hypothetical protein COL516b_005149 [Colletotrichum fioriniae]